MATERVSLSDTQLQSTAHKLRIAALNMIYKAGSGHPGGSFSAAEMVAVLFLDQLNRSSANVTDSARDRFVLSKGHASPIVYAALHECGLLSKSDLDGFRELGSPLQGHPDRVRMPAMEATSGSLGQGLSIAQGMALGQRLSGTKAVTYCMIGDGELQEGQVWESIMSAPMFNLNNLVLIVDANGGQLDGHTPMIMNIEDLSAKLGAFNWHVIEIDGHSITAVRDAIKRSTAVTDKPVAIISRTVKGKGVSFMENNIGFHGKAPTKEQYDQAMQELQAKIA